jgi:DNA (cytosine-5)-methyltransferase 1
MSELTHLSLFSGIGGLDLAAEWARFKTVGQCEWAGYPTKVLEKHWPDVPRWRDIRTLTGESFYERTGLRTVDVISGGFPCQPFSVAGKQKGKMDDRYLWPEMLRVIREIKPTWVLGENVPGILRIAGKTVCEDLEREGYAVTVFNFEAGAVGAPHRRERVFFVAHTRQQSERHNICRPCCESENSLQAGVWPKERDRFADGCQDAADSDGEGLSFSRPKPELSAVSAENGTELGGWWTTEPELGGMVDGLSDRLHGYWRVEPNIPRVATGVKNRVDRLKCLGNAVVPQQAYPIFQAIADIEREL